MDDGRSYIVRLDKTEIDRRGKKRHEVLDVVQFRYGMHRRQFGFHLRKGMWTVATRPMFKHTFRSEKKARAALKAKVPAEFIRRGWRASILVQQVIPGKPVARTRWIEIWPNPNPVDALGALCPVVEVEQD